MVEVGLVAMGDGLEVGAEVDRGAGVWVGAGVQAKWTAALAMSRKLLITTITRFLLVNYMRYLGVVMIV